MTNSIAPAAALTPERLAEYAALNFTDLMTPDAAAVVARMRDLLVGEIQRLREEHVALERALAATGRSLSAFSGMSASIVTRLARFPRAGAQNSGIRMMSGPKFHSR